MIFDSKLFDSFPFALAYFRVDDLQTMNLDCIKLDYANPQFEQLMELHAIPIDGIVRFSHGFHHQENTEEILRTIQVALVTQQTQKIRYFSVDGQATSSLIIIPLADNQFGLAFIEEDETLKHTKEQLEMLNHRFHQMAEFGRIFVWEVNTQGKYVYASATVTSILGFTPKQLLKMTIFDLYPKEKIQAFRQTIQTIFDQQKNVVNYENPIVNSEGEVIWLLTNGFPVYDSNGVFTGYRGFDQDITDRKLSQQALEASEEKYRLLTESVSDILWVYNYDQLTFTYFSPSIKKLTGYTPKQITTMAVSAIMNEASFDLIKKQLEKRIIQFKQDKRQNKKELLELELITKSNETVWVEVSFSFRFNDNQEVEVIGVGRDVTDRKKVQQKLHYLTFHDALTGLYNRAFYEAELNRLFVKRNMPLTLVLADINDLKLVNDAFGHLEGDKLIQTFAEILKQSTREDDIVARIGGDEFVLLLPKTNEDEASRIVNRIKHAIDSNAETKISLSVAIGSKTIYKKLGDYTQLFNEAEASMYNHKINIKEKQTNFALKMIESSFQLHHAKYYAVCRCASDYALAMAKKLEYTQSMLDVVKHASTFAFVGLLKDPTSDVYVNPRRVIEHSYHIVRQVSELKEATDVLLMLYKTDDTQERNCEPSNQSLVEASKLIQMSLDYCMITQDNRQSQQEIFDFLSKQWDNEDNLIRLLKQVI